MTAQNLKFDDKVLVRNTLTGATITVRLMDVGPGRKSQRAGTVIDLTLQAYKALGGSLKRGHIHITWKKSA
jgi:rare lipoprotein A (peptidoglycan hydrolase)